MLTESMKDVVWMLDTETMRFLYVSPSEQHITGYTPEEVMAEPVETFLMPEGAALLSQELPRGITDFVSGRVSPGNFTTAEIERKCKDGSTVWVEVIISFYRDGKTGHICVHGVSRDITERRQMQTELEEMATHDFLTGLPNRRLLLDRFEIAAALAHRNKTTLAIMSLDVDHFKEINDTYGHDTGDQVLKEIGRRLSGIMRGSDTLARMGGDEFVALFV
jgi:PAS domain S-box-containing protein